MNAIDEALDVTKAYIKEKTNPFFATFAVVWVAHNWKPVYAFLFFGKSYSLDDRMKWFDKYWEGTFLKNLVYVILISFAVLIVSLILINLSKLIIKFFSDVVTPTIYKVVKSTNVVERDKYNSMMKRNYDLENEIVEQRNFRIAAQREKERIETSFADNRDNLINQTRSETVALFNIIKELEITWVKEILSNTNNKTLVSKDKKIDKMIQYGILDSDNADNSSYYLTKTKKGYEMDTILSSYK